MLIYTFRTYPYLDQINQESGDIFIFSKLKQDLAVFELILTQTKPAHVIGFADTKQTSRAEPIAINRFNNGLVEPNGPSTLHLYIPPHNTFPLAAQPTHSFCNWTMYKIQQHIDIHNLKTQHRFIHLNQGDLPLLKELVRSRTI